MLSLLPVEWLLGALGALVAGVAAYFAGRQRERSKQDRRNLRASEAMRQKEKEVRDEDDDSLVDRLSRRGM